MTITLNLDDQIRRVERELSRLNRAGRERLRAETVALADASLEQWCRDDTLPDDRTTARLLLGIHEVVARDLVSVVAPEQLRAAPAFWTDLALAAPDHVSAPAWCVSGLLRWQAGDFLGALADAEMALDADPDHTMSGLLHCAAGAGFPAAELYGVDGTLVQRRAALTAAADGACQAG